MSFSANATAVRALEAEMDDIENIIGDLRNKHRSLRTQCNSNLPFFCLPLEICIVIFSLACHKGHLPRWKFLLVMTPFLISSVCHGWRVMARSAPELWCSVSLCMQPYIKDHSEFQAELLDQWLQLAKAWPLSIVMTFDKDEVLKNDEALENHEASENDEAFDSQSEECLAALAAATSVATSHSHQWESLDLFLPFSWAKIFKSGMGHCPNLRSLYLHINVTERVDSFQLSKPPFSTMFRHAPKLCTVTIGHEINVGLPYHQLEELTLWDDTLPEGFLSECTNLKIFRAHNCWLTPTSPVTVYLSKLVSLEIITFTLQHVVGYLVTPSLVSITIPLKGSEEIEAFSAFLTHSGVTLKHLSIIDYDPKEEKLL